MRGNVGVCKCVSIFVLYLNGEGIFFFSNKVGKCLTYELAKSTKAKAHVMKVKVYIL